MHADIILHYVPVRASYKQSIPEQHHLLLTNCTVLHNLLPTTPHQWTHQTQHPTHHQTKTSEQTSINQKSLNELDFHLSQKIAQSVRKLFMQSGPI